MLIEDMDPIELGSVSATTRGGVMGTADGDSGFMQLPGLADD